MGYEINYSGFKGNKSLTTHPYYQKYAFLDFTALGGQKPLIQTDLNACIANDESVEIIAYLSWLLRVLNLLTL